MGGKQTSAWPRRWTISASCRNHMPAWVTGKIFMSRKGIYFLLITLLPCFLFVGVLYLQYGDETKQFRMPNEITTIDTVRALFVSAFPQQLNMKMLESPSVAVYVKDDMRNMYYELTDVRWKSCVGVWKTWMWNKRFWECIGEHLLCFLCFTGHPSFIILHSFILPSFPFPGHILSKLPLHRKASHFPFPKCEEIIIGKLFWGEAPRQNVSDISEQTEEHSWETLMTLPPVVLSPPVKVWLWKLWAMQRFSLWGSVVSEQTCTVSCVSFTSSLTHILAHCFSSSLYFLV